MDCGLYGALDLVVLFMDKYTAVSFPYFLWMDAYCGIAVDAFWQQAARRQLTAELSAGTDTKLIISLVEDEL